MDQGKDLAQSPEGPWTKHLHSRASTYPVIQYHSKMTSRNTNRIDSRGHSVALQHPNRERELLSTAIPFPQSGTLLPLEYESLLALVNLRRRSTVDPVLSLLPVFAHAAFSEVQLLNLIDQEVTRQINFSQQQYGLSVQNLKFLSTTIERHCTSLESSLQGINTLFMPYARQCDCSGRGPRSPKSSQKVSEPGDNSFGSGYSATTTTGPFTVEGVIQDYQELLVRARKTIE